MPDRLPDRFFDTVTLSNFALSGVFDLLVDRYGRTLRVTEQVRAELAAGRIRGYSELQLVEPALAAGRILPAEPMTMLLQHWNRALNQPAIKLEGRITV